MVENAFAISRKLFENPIWYMEPFTKGQAWVDLFGNANYSDSQFQIRGNIVTIKRGQIGWSERTLAKRWKWSRGKVRRFLDWLEKEEMIVQQKNTLTTVISIVKYEDYQFQNKKNGPQTDHHMNTEKTVFSKKEPNLIPPTVPQNIPKIEPKTTEYVQQTVPQTVPQTDHRRTTDSTTDGTHKNKDNKVNKVNKEILMILDHWNSKDIIVHKPDNGVMKKITQQMVIALKTYSKEEILKGIDNYATMLKDVNCKTAKYSWSLALFLKQDNCLPYFVDDGVRWLNYEKKHNKDKPIIYK